jgi:hypothetical protein
MKAVGIIGIILIVVFVMVMLMTFAFHIVVFKLLLITRDAATIDSARNEIATGMLEQAWTV